MDAIVQASVKAANHISLKNKLISQGINKDVAANIAHMFLFKLNSVERAKVLKTLNEN